MCPCRVSAVVFETSKNSARYPQMKKLESIDKSQQNPQMETPNNEQRFSDYCQLRPIWTKS